MENDFGIKSSVFRFGVKIIDPGAETVFSAASPPVLKKKSSVCNFNPWEFVLNVRRE
jgi:hypothetical protein